MPEPKKPKGYWNKNRCQSAARAYATRAEFARGNKTAYNVAADSGWLDEICAHMPKNAKHCSRNNPKNVTG